jgi:hypothetical protein
MSLQSASIVVSYLQEDIGSFMLPQPYALPSQSFLGNSTNLFKLRTVDIKFCNPHNVHRENILGCVFFCPPR